METEIWKAHPEYVGIEVSTLGNVRTQDRLGSRENITYSKKWRVLKQRYNRNGYMRVGITIDRKWTMKLVHRLVAQTFIPNSDNLPQVNHKNCNRADNRVSNLEWCDNSYNQRYREKFGEAQGHSLFAVNLDTQELSRFHSQHEASRALGVSVGNINNVIKGRINQTGGYWFTEDYNNSIEIENDKLKDIASGMKFRGVPVFAVNLDTSEVSLFKSQSEAGRVLGFSVSRVNEVIKGKRKQSHGYWFMEADKSSDDVIKQKLHDIGKTGLKLNA